LVVGTSTGAATDGNGHYSVNVSSLQDTLRFSFIGYETKTVAIDGRTGIEIQLKPAIFTSGNQLVVIGYGKKKKKNIIGAVTSVSDKKITSKPVSSVTNAIAGEIPGVIVHQKSGEPGSNKATILIRGKSSLGSNSPLIVVNGVPGGDLNSIDPSNIKSLTVLKDASAAIYGARAANGVILVETKQGKVSAPTFKYNFYEGWQTPTKLPEMTDAVTYAEMIREEQEYQGIPSSQLTYSKEDIEKFKSGKYPWTHPNTNWYDAVLSKYSNIRHHNLSVGGGTKKTQYYGSFGVQTNDGIYKTNSTKYNRYNLRAHLDTKINKYLKVGIDLNGEIAHRKYPPKSVHDIFNNGIIRSRPTEPAFYPNGLPGPAIEYGDNPVVTSSFKTGFDDRKYYSMENKFNANLKIPHVSGLDISAYFDYAKNFNVRKVLEKPWTLYSLDESAYFDAGNTGKEDGSDFLVPSEVGVPDIRVHDYNSGGKTMTYNIKLSYKKSINENNKINAFIGAEASKNSTQGIDAFRRHFISAQLPYLFAGGVPDQTIGSSVGIDSRASYFGRVSYNYKEKYLLQFMLRRDGSVRFSKKHGRWGTFPSVEAGWIISNEEFWQRNLSFINYFKIKASWGKMGNDAVAPFQYLRSYAFSTGALFGNNKTYQSGLVLAQAPNPNITWEISNYTNLGLESSFLDDKINLDLNFFYERRSNILIPLNASVPDFTGLTLPDENYGIVNNKGLEAVLSYKDQVGDNFSFAIKGDFSYHHNKIINFDEPKKNVPWHVKTGHPMGAVLLYKAIGVFHDEADVKSYPHVEGAKPGAVKIEDYNGDGKITSEDRILYDKTATPKVTYGGNLSLEYKNWSLNVLIQGVGNVMRMIYNDIQGPGGNYYEFNAKGRWTPENKTADKPRAFNRDNQYWRRDYKTNWLYHNMAYARLKNLQLSYTIPKNLQKTIGLKNTEIYFSGENLFFIYK
jgi:TonB-linked SusC/RagA family outer membrane protein